MKIAFFHELPFGGAHRVVVEYGKILSKNHDVDVFYVDREEEKDLESIFNKSYFFKFSQKSGKGWGTRLYNDTVGLFFLSILHWRIAQLIDEQKYDFVFVHPSKFTQAPFILRYLKTKTIYFCQEPLRIAHDPLLSVLPNASFPKKVYEWANRFFREIVDASNMGRAGKLLANSKFAATWIEKAYAKKAEVCYLGVDTKLFAPSTARKTDDILFLGQKIAIEGYDLFEKAVSLFEKRPKIAYIERDEHGKGIADSDLVSAIQKAKVVVCLSRNEPFGLTALEAASCEVPVVAINEGGFVESVIDGKTGFLVEPSPRPIFEKLELLLQDEKLRNKLGREARKNVLANWTWVKSVERFSRIIGEWGKNQ